MLKHSEESYDVYKELSKSNELEVKPPVNKKNKKVQMHQKKIMEILNKASKEEFFIQKSLFIFSLSNPLRRFCKFLITSDNYEIFRRIIIMINFVFLVFETIPKLEKIGRYSSYAFTLIYILEFFIIIIARGFVLGNNTYLRSPWNFFDFLVVVFGVINFFPNLKGNILSLKLVQLTKPFNKNDKNGEENLYFK
jgi:voltage-gated sodium channel type IX alpha